MRTITLMLCFGLAGAASLRAQVAGTATVPPPPVSAQQRLHDAQQALAAAPETTVPRHGQTSQSQLTEDFSALVSSYGAAEPGGAWKVSFSAVERDVVRLIGGGGPLFDPAASLRPIRMLRSELLGSDALGPLTVFRTDLELFYDAATTGLSTLTD